MCYIIKELLLADGTSPFADWFACLDATAAAKVRSAIARIEAGNTSNVEWFKGIGEYKLNWGPGYRVYLAKDGPTLIILLGGGTKARRQRDIDHALALWAQYKRRKAQVKKES